MAWSCFRTGCGSALRGDPAIVGRSLALDGRRHIIGVLPPGTPWLDAGDVFVPLVRTRKRTAAASS
jgi:hypothetical protein